MIKTVSYNYAKRSVTVHYVSGAVRTYKGRVPFSVCEYLISDNFDRGMDMGIKWCEIAQKICEGVPNND